MNLLLITALFSIGLTAKPDPNLRNYFGKRLGTFVAYDYRDNDYVFINQSMANKPLSPCSTFKILNSAIALETGVATNEEFLIPWDQDKDPPKSSWPKAWRQHHSLQSAVRNSVVWYFQEIARRIGKTRMKSYLDKVGYGNQDISGGIDEFWLSSSLKISPVSQVRFLRSFFGYKTSFSKRTVNIVKAMLLKERTSDYILYAKTGTCLKKAWSLACWRF